jgi:hypothetical protein
MLDPAKSVLATRGTGFFIGLAAAFASGGGDHVTSHKALLYTELNMSSSPTPGLCEVMLPILN